MPEGHVQNESPHAAGFVEGTGKLLGDRFGHVFCLWAFLPLDDLELHVVTFLQALVAFACYSAVMDKNIRTIIATNKTEALGVVEPLHFTLDAGHLHFPPNGVLTTVGRSQPLPVTS